MTLPALFLGLLIALSYGALYHLARGGGFWRLMLYLSLSILGFAILGFAAGHVPGLWRGWTLIPLGPLNLGLSTLGSVLVLLTGDWLSRIEGSS